MTNERIEEKLKQMRETYKSATPVEKEWLIEGAKLLKDLKKTAANPNLKLNI